MLLDDRQRVFCVDPGIEVPEVQSVTLATIFQSARAKHRKAFGAHVGRGPRVASASAKKTA